MDKLTEILVQARKVTGEDASAELVASRVLYELFRLPPGTVQDLLLPLVTPWVHEHSRAEVREKERRAWSPRTGAEDTGNPAQEAMRALLRETCYVPGHGLVAWGKLTVDLHQARMRYLEAQKAKYVGGINATIRRHEVSVELLSGSECGTLDEYARSVGGDLSAVLTPEVTA
jgi:hypothetical protein